MAQLKQMDIIKFSYTEVLKDGVCMSIEMWFISNSDNALLQDNKAMEIGFVTFIGLSPNYITVVKIRIN